MSDQVSLNVTGKLHRIYREKNGDVVVNHAGSKKQNGKYDKINLSDMAGVKSVKGGVKATTNWHKEHPHNISKSMVAPGVFKPASSLTKKERKQVLRGVKSHKNYSPKKPDYSKFRNDYEKGIAMTNSVGLSRLRKPDLEGSDFVKLRSNVYTRPDSGIKNRHLRGLPKMRRPTVVTQGNLPKGAVAGVIPTGSKSSPRVISVNAKQKEKMERVLPMRYVMAHEGVHANTKRNAYRSSVLSQGRKGTSPTTRPVQLEEARADDHAVRQTGVSPFGSYKTMSQVRPFKLRHYRQHRAKLSELKENKVVKYDTDVNKGIPSSFKGKVLPFGVQRNFPKSLQTKVGAHAKGRMLSKLLSGNFYVDPLGMKRYNIASARRTAGAPSNVDKIAGKRKGKFETSLAGQRAEAYRQERLSRVNKGLPSSLKRFSGKNEIGLPRFMELPPVDESKGLTQEALKRTYKNTRVINNFTGKNKLSKNPSAKVVLEMIEKPKSTYKSSNIGKFDSPAWTRSAGKNPKGGLNAKGRASARAEGHNLKPPVKAGNNPRRASFLARMGNMPGPEHKPNGEPTRLLLSLQAWGASSKADAKRKAASISRVGKATSLVYKNQLEIPGIGNVVRQTAKRKLPTQGRWRHLSGQTSQVRIVGPNSSSKDYFDVIDSKDVKRSLHRSQIIFTKDKPISKSIAYDSPMNQSRFGGASAVGKAYEDKPKPVWEKPNPNKESDPLSKKRKASAKARARAANRPYPNLIDNMAVAKAKSKKRKKNGQPVRYNAQRPFAALAQAEIAHERATAAGHTTVQTHVPVAPKTKPKRVSTARNSVRPSRPVPMPPTRRFLGPKPIAAGIGLAALGAYALHRRNQVNKSVYTQGFKESLAQTKAANKSSKEFTEKMPAFKHLAPTQNRLKRLNEADKAGLRAKAEQKYPKHERYDSLNEYMQGYSEGNQSAKIDAYVKSKRKNRLIAGAGVTALGAQAQSNKKNKVSKANPMASRVLEGASRAAGRVRPVGSGSGGVDAAGRKAIRENAASAMRGKPRVIPAGKPGTPLKDIAPDRARTRLATPGGQGGTFAVDRKAMVDEAGEAFRRANNVKGKELVLARKPGQLVSTRPVVKPVASNAGKELERRMKPKKSSANQEPLFGNRLSELFGNSSRDKSYLAAGLAATGGGLYAGNQFSKAYDAQGNYVPDAPARNSNNMGNTALAGAGVAGAAMGYKKLNTASTLPQTAPNAASDAAAASAREQALKATRNSEKAMADAKVTAAQAGRRIPIVRNRRVKSAQKEAFKATKMSTTQAQIADKATKEAARTANVARNVPKFQRATANHGLGLIAGGAALAAAGMRNNRNSK
jgi:hypothetical protein